MKTVAALLAALSLTAVACAGTTGSDGASSASNDTAVSAPSAASTTFEPGKYVVDGKILMIYDTCSAANFLGEAAKGAIDPDGTIHAQEGDVCGQYTLATVGDGEIRVTWAQDPTAHLDADTIRACSSNNGTYLLMEPSPFIAPKAGAYAGPSGVTLTFVDGCGTQPLLTGSDGSTLAAGVTDDDHPAGYLATEEGDVCSGYSYTGQTDGSVKVTWVPAVDASVNNDPSIVSGCKSLEGVYAAK